MTALCKMPRRIGRNREVAPELSETGIHEARILATIIDGPAVAAEAQIEWWVTKNFLRELTGEKVR